MITRGGNVITLVVTATDSIAIDWVQFKLWDYRPGHEQWVLIGNAYQSGPHEYTFEWELDVGPGLLPHWNEVDAFVYDSAGNLVTPRILIFHISSLFLPITTK